MKRKIFKITLLVIAVTCFISVARAQVYRSEAKISRPGESGYYHILIEPRISAHLNSDFSDIRIFEKGRTEVPYIIREEKAFTAKKLFTGYSIVSKDQVKGCCTRLVLQNPSGSRISSLSLFMRNSDVHKKMRLSGSDDKAAWYVIKENYEVNSVFSDSGTAEIKILDFPLSNYEYYLLEIDDSTTAPVNILSAGYYTTYSRIGNYTELPAPSIMQSDSSSVKRSFVKVSFNAPYNFDRLAFEIEGPKHYLRNARLMVIDEKGKIAPYAAATFTLSSRAQQQPDIGLKKVKDFYLVIDNNDDVPLKIKGISGFQLTRYLAAYLEKDKEYILRFGSSTAGFPTYDVEYFRDSIPSDIPLVTVGEVITAGTNEQKTERSSTEKILIWSAIGAVVILLGFMSFKMVREMKK